MTAHIAIASSLFFDIMPNLSFTSGEDLLAFILAPLLSQNIVNSDMNSLRATILYVVFAGPVQSGCPRNEQPWTATSPGLTQILREPN